MKIGREEKLVPNLKDKKGYAVHIKNTKSGIKAWCKIDKVHRVMGFEDSKCMNPYIMLNTRLRMASKNGFVKVFLS